MCFLKFFYEQKQKCLNVCRRFGKLILRKSQRVCRKLRKKEPPLFEGGRRMLGAESAAAQNSANF